MWAPEPLKKCAKQRNNICLLVSYFDQFIYCAEQNNVLSFKMQYVEGEASYANT